MKKIGLHVGICAVLALASSVSHASDLALQALPYLSAAPAGLAQAMISYEEIRATSLENDAALLESEASQLRGSAEAAEKLSKAKELRLDAEYIRKNPSMKFYRKVRNYGAGAAAVVIGGIFVLRSGDARAQALGSEACREAMPDLMGASSRVDEMAAIVRGEQNLRTLGQADRPVCLGTSDLPAVTRARVSGPMQSQGLAPAEGPTPTSGSAE